MGNTPSVVTSIFSVFTEVVEWFVTTLNEVSALFYSSTTGLTFFGTITIIGVGIAVTLMVIAMLRSLLHLRG